MQSGLAQFRPNANAGGGAAARGAPMQPAKNGMLRMETRFQGGGGARGGVHHDPLDALGGHAGRVSSAVANEVQGRRMGRQGREEGMGTMGRSGERVMVVVRPRVML